MLITPKEESTIGKLYDYLNRNPKEELTLSFPGFPKYKAVLDTCYETDNGLEIDEDGYEEYAAILLRRIDTGELIELTYHDFPARLNAKGLEIHS